MKQKFLKYISEMRNQLPEAEEALQNLKAIVVDMETPKAKQKTDADSPQFLIPAEVQGLENTYVLYADGACRGNPGPGAWGCVVQDNQSNIVLSAADISKHTTNNKMELSGVIEGIRLLTAHVDLNTTNLLVVSDSMYVVNGMNSWVAGWKKRGWKKADKKVPENVELWKDLDQLRLEVYKIKFDWVKGHSGHPQNEFCDQLANEALDNAGF